ncbi:hypothetical protein HH214_06940 [Mucilaginibacter robiniae]|uniref:DUF4293 family protein n=1 Tax=Mucilaginibacter robiniae TaxID=2728022 RepID=A0A7L5DX69_9SPHI|nr:hypothetical protein [Mucilaginibacter robiniae]QJD95625.1 hypothetical protein HH214_06940 [Mucilaginibacter robiniae]
MKRFFIAFGIATIMIALPPALLNYAGNEKWLIPGFWLIFQFFSSLTFLICLGVIWGQLKNGTLGGQIFLGATTFKFILCMTIALIYLHKYQVNDVVFVLNYFYLYFLYTAFEIYSLLSNLRVQNKKEKSRN